MKVKSLIIDELFIKNNPDIFNNLISLKAPIPWEIRSIIFEIYPDIDD